MNVVSFEARKEPFKYYKFADSLVRDGWRTPDRYSNNRFEPIPASSGVYLFSLIRFVWRESSGFPEVLYIGKSFNLRNRLGNHDIFPIIQEQIPEFCIETGISYMLQRWFQRGDRNLLYKREIELIKKYDPPFNLQHRNKRVLHG